MASLGLSRVMHSIVGDVNRRGVSGGEKKRVNIGLEVMVRLFVSYLAQLLERFILRSNIYSIWFCCRIQALPKVSTSRKDEKSGIPCNTNKPFLGVPYFAHACFISSVDFISRWTNKVNNGFSSFACSKVWQVSSALTCDSSAAPANSKWPWFEFSPIGDGISKASFGKATHYNLQRYPSTSQIHLWIVWLAHIAWRRWEDGL